MSAIARLTAAGFHVELVPPDGIGITPTERLTDLQRQWVKENRPLLLDELIQAANDTDDWQYFVNLVVSHDCMDAEVEAMFTRQDKTDLLREPVYKLQQHARTIANSIKVKRMVVAIEQPLPARWHAVDPIHVKRCIDCQHFKRIEHPRLGKCTAGEPEGIAGNWDTDTRAYCKRFEVTP